MWLSSLVNFLPNFFQFYTFWIDNVMPDKEVKRQKNMQEIVDNELN